MAKTLYFTNYVANTHRSSNSARLSGVAAGWSVLALSEIRGIDTSGTVVFLGAICVAGPTSGIEVGPTRAEWISAPLSADFTISGTITLNLWAAETDMNANAAVNAVIEKLAGATGALTQIAQSTNAIEVPLTTPTAQNFTVTPTSTACNRGDRLRIRVFADDAGTMGAAGEMDFYYDRSTAAQGESFVTFTENLTFEALATPTGSTYYLTDTAETINPGAATEKKALTTRGSGSVNAVTNTAAGFTAGIQVTDSGGGTAIEWYTPPLNAVTLGGVTKFNIRALESSASANASLKAEVAITATDGSGATVWGISYLEATNNTGALSTSDAARIAWVAGDDTSVSAGQRLRFRIYVDDVANTALATSFTVTVSYNGVSAAAAGDTYIILPVAVTEQAAATAIPDVGMALTVT